MKNMKLLILTDVITANPNSSLKPNSNPNRNLSQICVIQPSPCVMNVVGEVRIPDYQTIAIYIQYTTYMLYLYNVYTIVPAQDDKNAC